MCNLRSLLLPLLLFLLPSSSSSFRSLHQILPTTVSDGVTGANELHCGSWRFSVETNDAGPWNTVPSRCGPYVADYMNGLRYVSDSDVVAADALVFARGAVTGDGKDTWVFDVDETLLSNLPYYASVGYGVVAFNETKWNEWVEKARAPALLASLRLYNELSSLGFRLVLVTGRDEEQRNVTEENLRFAGYSCWDRLILRNATDHGKAAVVYKVEKRALLQSEGYRILGNSGDQWSDLFGSPVAQRSFKLPNPMYYIS